MTEQRQLKIVHRYQLEGSTLVVAVNERGQVGIGLAQLHPDAEVLTPVDPAQLQQVLEQARVDSHRIQNQSYPLPGLVLEVLGEAPPEGFTTGMVRARIGSTEYTHADVLRELRYFERQGKARRLVAQPGGLHWALARPAGTYSVPVTRPTIRTRNQGR
jgi:hypothetical protein